MTRGSRNPWGIYWARHLAIALLLATLSYGQEVTSASLEGSGSGMLGIGGRLSWVQRPFDDPRLWIDAHAVLQPLPRLFVEGGWGRSSQTRRGRNPADTNSTGRDTSFSETRWDLTMGVVILQGTATGYIPALWRRVSQRHSQWGDASWTEIGSGAGAIIPIREWLSLQTETIWVSPLDPHKDMALGPGREVDGSHLEISLSFLAYIK